MPIDTRVAWTGKVDNNHSTPIRIEAASWQGRPVLFALTSERSGSRGPTIASGVFSLIAWGNLLVAIWMAWNNRRLGRGDRRVAMRLAAFMAIASLGVRAVQGSGFAFLANGLPTALSAGAVAWVFYTAIEPYVRRHWPEGLISWARFTAGRFRDPLVASHILAGLVAMEAFSLVGVPLMISASSLIPAFSPEAASLSSTADGFAQVFRATGGILEGLYLLILVVVLRLGLRKLLVADVMASVFMALVSIAGGSWLAGRPWNQVVGLAFLTITSMIWMWLLRRFGLLAMLTVWAFYGSITFLPLRTTGWVAERYIPFHLIPIALAAWALWVVLSSPRRPLTDSAA
jgi:hypothetical protein